MDNVSAVTGAFDDAVGTAHDVGEFSDDALGGIAVDLNTDEDEVVNFVEGSGFADVGGGGARLTVVGYEEFEDFCGKGDVRANLADV